jgi:hypothetical protein
VNEPDKPTFYGVIDGVWHIVIADKVTVTRCASRLVPVSVQPYLAGDLCPACAEIVTREIVEKP